MNPPHANVLLTGASGFVGKALLQHLVAIGGFSVAIASRQDHNSPPAVKTHRISGIGIDTDWGPVFKEPIDIVIHAAARAHVMRETDENPLEAFRRVNVDGTLKLAEAACQAGVKRFVFISSIKVNGEETTMGECFTAHDAPAPRDAYGTSKFEAETALLSMAKRMDMEVVIIRPTLIYGPGVKGNFVTMMKWINCGFPLPLASVNNLRSFVSIQNLIDFLTVCIQHPNAANEIFLVSDGRDISTTQLLRNIAKAMGRPSRLVPVSTPLLHAAASLMGRAAIAQRLLGSLQVSILKNQEMLGWHPATTMDETLKATADHYLESLECQ